EIGQPTEEQLRGEKRTSVPSTPKEKVNVLNFSTITFLRGGGVVCWDACYILNNTISYSRSVAQSAFPANAAKLNVDAPNERPSGNGQEYASPAPFLGLVKAADAPWILGLLVLLAGASYYFWGRK
ncbi:hypothetical protein COT29_01825, partial [Candidatus Micrarchaeota archaeon CG08_land_8_20_14_0_20_59_11]